MASKVCVCVCVCVGGGGGGGGGGEGERITFPKLNGATIEVWEWISNFIPHFIMDVIIHPCWD